jgi:hypothetical protein
LLVRATDQRFRFALVFGGSLFLKPLGTFSTMQAEGFAVNRIVSESAPFPHKISACLLCRLRGWSC